MAYKSVIKSSTFTCLILILCQLFCILLHGGSEETNSSPYHANIVTQRLCSTSYRAGFCHKEPRNVIES